MNIDLETVIYIIAIGVSIISSISMVKRTTSLKEVIKPILAGCSTIITFFLFLTLFENFNQISNEIIDKYFQTTVNKGLVNIGIIALMFIAVKLVIESILMLINSFAFHNSIDYREKHKPILLVFAVIFGAVRGMIILVLICIPFVFYNSIADSNKRIEVFDNFHIYNKVEKLVDSNKIKNISNGLLQNVTENQVYYYNGITIDEGVKSNASIEKKAKDIVKNYSKDREKAKALYTWVGGSITYDDNKATKVLSGQTGYESGAIPTFNSKRGICFDYSCLYTAMAKSVGLKTRVIIGEAYNGKEFVSHSWNQVYLADEGKWVNLDCTFYSAGNYFDNSNFNSEHRQTSVAGEF